MIEISDQSPFALGNNRACYRHPQHHNRCIKIPLKGCGPEDIRSEAPWWQSLRRRVVVDENFRDFKYLTRIHRRLGTIAEQHLPRVYGFADTDLGRGLEVELVLDSDGHISIPGNQLGLHPIKWESIRCGLIALEDFCLQHRILIRDPGPQNLVFQRLDGGTLNAKIIDGYGSSSFIPIEAWIEPCARSYTMKKHKKLRKRTAFRYESIGDKPADTLQASPKTLSH